MPAALPAGVVADLAAELALAERQRRPVSPLTERHPGLTLSDAYRIQQLNVERRIAASERVLGHKIGLTAVAMQELFGVREPDYGHLLDTMFLAAREPLDLRELIDPQIEVEPAFVLGRSLRGPGLGIADVIAATDYVTACFEVIDSRITDWRIRLQDTVADNGSSSRVLLGSQRLKPSQLELDQLDTVLTIDGADVEFGNTGAILGHPANGIAWLANTLAGYGVTLEPGAIVLPGTCTRCRRIAGHRQIRGSIAGLGTVTLELEHAPTIDHSSVNPRS
jgi:2-keto-4-pentenoate hydratase